MIAPADRTHRPWWERSTDSLSYGALIDPDFDELQHNELYSFDPDRTDLGDGCAWLRSRPGCE